MVRVRFFPRRAVAHLALSFLCLFQMAVSAHAHTQACPETHDSASPDVTAFEKAAPTFDQVLLKIGTEPRNIGKG